MASSEKIGTYEYSRDTSMDCGMLLTSGRYVGYQVEAERHIPHATQKNEQRRSLSMEHTTVAKPHFAWDAQHAVGVGQIVFPHPVFVPSRILVDA